MWLIALIALHGERCSRPAQAAAVTATATLLVMPANRLAFTLLFILFHDLLGPHLRLGRVLPRGTQRPSLPHQIPTLIDFHLNIPQTRTLFSRTQRLKPMFFRHQVLYPLQNRLIGRLVIRHTSIVVLAISCQPIPIADSRWLTADGSDLMVSVGSSAGAG